MKKTIKTPPADSRTPAPQPGKSPQILTLEHQFSGPLPDPLTLQRYNDLVPGAAERILAYAEQHAKHGMDMEKQVLDAQLSIEMDNLAVTRRGQIYGFGATVLAFSVTTLALVLGYPVVAGTISSATIVALAAVFVTGRARHGKQNDAEQ